MQIRASWSPPLSLQKCAPGGLIYDIDLASIPNSPAVYVFGRKYGKAIIPIYVGETLTLRNRVKSHLNSLPLMRAIENAPKGARFLIYCTIETKSAERAKKHIQIMEKALILHAQSEGHSLFNKRGTRLPTHEIYFTGNRTSEALAPRTMLVRRVAQSKKAAQPQ